MILAIAVSRKWVRQGPDYNDVKSNGKADYLEVTERESEWWCLRSQSGERFCWFACYFSSFHVEKILTSFGELGKNLKD